jgi:hypothetical protein
MNGPVFVNAGGLHRHGINSNEGGQLGGRLIRSCFWVIGTGGPGCFSLFV